MERPPRNVAAVSSSQQVPTEQNMYADAHMWRAIAFSRGAHTHSHLPGWITSDPPMNQAQLTQMGILGERLST